ncbi:MAG: arylsulfatase [Candidatus Latescibacteria bacterium]|nr:arylsulfatase [Candidatus Latescibacterota bacterium]
MGFSDLGCYGGEMCTPHLNRLASGGLRFTQFYNTARCCPSRASLLTGLHPHQADVGHMVDDDGVDGYLGDLSGHSVTIAEVLKNTGYATFMSGKWHVTKHVDGPKHNWPCQRGFDDYYGIITGASDYYNPSTLTINNKRINPPDGPFYFTDSITDEAVSQISSHTKSAPSQPFFSYVAYTSPHWPLHAPADDISRYDGRFKAGWDQLRIERLKRMVDSGIIHPDWLLTPRDATQTAWTQAENKPWQQRRMEVYAAQIDRMDQGIGRIIAAVEEAGRLDDTLILFLADNGGCAEEIQPAWANFVRGRIAHATTRDGRTIQVGNDPEIMPGGEETYQSYGVPWANLSNTPFREYKHWVHEGGIATPLIAHWPEGITDSGALRDQPAQLPDIMATCLDIAQASYPDFREGHSVIPHEGYSIQPIFANEDSLREMLYWEHEGNCAVRYQNWKLVRKFAGAWELYDMKIDRTEMDDLAERYPEKVASLSMHYQSWADRCGVQPWESILSRRERAQNGG